MYYDQSTGDFLLLQSGVTTEFYMTTIALTKGSTYSFKVQARNSVGQSALSSELAVLVA